MAYQTGAVQLRFAVLGETQVLERLEGVISDVQDWRPALEKIADSFQRHMEQVFASEGSARQEGAAWTPLSPSYARWKAKHYPGLPILTRKGDLRRSLTKRNARGSIRRIGKTTLVIGTQLTVPSGRWVLGVLHHEGEPPVPKRRVISINNDLVAEWIGYLRAQMSWEKR